MSSQRYRVALACTRLVLLFVLLCFLGLYTGLTTRQRDEQGWGLTQPLPPITAPAAQVPFVGINVDLSNASPQEQRVTLTRLQASGFGWVRQRFDWRLLEPQPKHFDWSSSDQLLPAITAAHLTPVVLLDGSPSWARAAQDVGASDNPFAPPADPTSFASFASAFARRYGNQVRFYQIWDEPNLAPHWGNRLIEPIDYAQLLKVGASAIRTADSDAVILTAALAPTSDRGHTAIDEHYFLKRLYAAGTAPYFDAVAVQPFGFGFAPDDPREQPDVLNFQRIKLVRRVMVAANDGATPLWAVRFGWNTRLDSPWKTVSPANQVAYAQQALTLAYDQWPWLATLGWLIDQPARPPTDPMWGFALTPALADSLHTWTSTHQSTARPRTATSSSPIFVFTLLPLSGLLAVWRAAAAILQLPWGQWRLRYSRWHPRTRLGVWVALLLLHYIVAWPPLIIGCWLVTALLLMADPQVGLWISALLLPFYYQHKELHLVNGVQALAPAHIALLCLSPALLAAQWRAASTIRLIDLGKAIKRFASSRHPVDWLALTWLVVSLASSTSVWYWPDYWQGLLDLVLAPLLFYWAVRQWVFTPQQWRWLALALYGSGVVVAIVGLVGWLRGSGVSVDGILRLIGPYYSPNQAALYLERTFCLGCGFMFTAANQHRWHWRFSIGLITVALLLTASRGAWLLGLPVGIAILVWRRLTINQQRPSVFQIKQSWWISLVLVSGLLLASALYLFRARLSNSQTISSRLMVWQTTLHIWRDYPWFGVGTGEFFWRYPAYLTHLTSEPNLYHPHNLWLEFGAIWGVAGILWCFGLIIYLVHGLFAARRSHPSPCQWITFGLLAGLFAGLAHAQVDTFGALPDLAGWHWLTLGLLVQAPRANAKE